MADNASPVKYPRATTATLANLINSSLIYNYVAEFPTGEADSREEESRDCAEGATGGRTMVDRLLETADDAGQGIKEIVVR